MFSITITLAVIPDPDEPGVKELVASIGSTAPVLWVDVKVQEEARKGHCFYNVNQLIKRVGGKPLLGWLILKSDIAYEAEAHCVWSSGNGSLIDITPREENGNKRLFLPDPQMVDDGSPIPSHRINRTGKKIVDDIIMIKKVREHIEAKGKEDDLGFVTPASDDHREAMEKVDELALYYGAFHMEGGDVDDQCFCGNRKLYGDCHHIGLPTLLNTATKNIRQN